MGKRCITRHTRVPHLGWLHGGRGSRIRTCDPRFKRPLLYRLSYAPTGPAGGRGRLKRSDVHDLCGLALQDVLDLLLVLLGEFLDLPAVIQDQVPSPDMIKGVSDEYAMGISYEHMDMILYGIEKKFSDEQILELGVTPEQINHVRLMNKLSEWKRSN